MVNKNVGDTVYVGVRVRNTGTVSHTFKIGVSIGYGNTWYDLGYYNDGYGEYRDVTISPGTEQIVQRTLQIPNDTNITDVWATVKDQSLNTLDGTIKFNEINMITLPGETFITPADDSYVRENSPDSIEGNRSSLIASLSASGLSWEDIYLKFDIPDVNITQAFLRLFVMDWNSGSTGNILVSNSRNITWSENILTFNNRPLIAGDLSPEYYFNTNVNFWTNLDLTNFIKANRGKTVTLTLSGVTLGVGRKLSSKEGANPPNLRIIYT